MTKKGVITTVAKVIWLTIVAVSCGLAMGIAIQGYINKTDPREEVRNNHYWLSDETTSWATFDLKLYLSDHGCKSLRLKNANFVSGEYLYKYQFERNGAEFNLSSLLQPHKTESQDVQNQGRAYDVIGSRLEVVLSDGTKITSQPEIAERPWRSESEQMVSTADRNFLCSRSALGQLFYVIQHNLDDPTNWTAETVAELHSIGLDVTTPTT